MTSAKLAADGIPHQFQNLDAFDMIHPVGAAHVLRQILVDLRIVQVPRAGRQVDQPGGHVTFDDVLDLRIGHWRHHAVGL